MKKTQLRWVRVPWQERLSKGAQLKAMKASLNEAILSESICSASTWTPPEVTSTRVQDSRKLAIQGNSAISASVDGVPKMLLLFLRPNQLRFFLLGPLRPSWDDVRKTLKRALGHVSKGEG